MYFTDPGTLCHLAGLKDPEHAAAGPMGGAIFETPVLMEVVKTLAHRGADPHLYFGRTSTGAEVDLVVDTGAMLIPIETRLSATPRPAMADGVLKLRRDLGKAVGRGTWVIQGP